MEISSQQIIYQKKYCHKYQHKNMLQKSYILINKLLFQSMCVPKTRYKKQKKLYQKIAPKKTINLKPYKKPANKSKHTTLIKNFSKFDLMHNNIYKEAHFKKAEWNLFTNILDIPASKILTKLKYYSKSVNIY